MCVCVGEVMAGGEEGGEGGWRRSAFMILPIIWFGSSIERFFLKGDTLFRLERFIIFANLNIPRSCLNLNYFM